MSYTIDVFNRKITPTTDIISFSAFVTFFPQLVAGPIERAANLLPQFAIKRVFNYFSAVDGLKQILWGLFKKIVIADNCAIHANNIFNNMEEYSGSTLLIGALFFSFQIYGDFSGYSDIALGTSRLFGFNLMKNFNYPYFSRDIAEFWRRWHISLSSWFRDYVYFPLGGSRGGTFFKVRNTFVIFLLSGFWHGANWTFIIWGLLNAVYFLPLLLTKKNRNNLEIVAKGTVFPSVKEIFQIIFTFILTVFAWIFFRSENISQALNYISNIFSLSFFTIPVFSGAKEALLTFMLVIVFIIIEWYGRENDFAIKAMGNKWNRTVRLSFYYVLLIAIVWFTRGEQQFIYFQF